jgi:hypothetical protein
MSSRTHDPAHPRAIRGVAIAFVMLASCSSNGSSGASDAVTFHPQAAAMGGTMFTNPLDAAPNSDASMFYFTALAMGEDVGAAVFASAPGGPPTLLASGAPLAAPFAIVVSSDDKTLYIADPAAGDPDDNGDAAPSAQASGRIFALPVGGGTPQPVAGAGFHPRGLELVRGKSGDMLYFSGRDPMDGQPGVFSVSPSGGTPTVLAKGAPLVDPSGLAATRKGDVYVVDTVSDSAASTIYQLTASGAPTILFADLHAGYPAGLALSMDEASLFASGLDAESGRDEITRIPVADPSKSVQLDEAINQFTRSAGAHRAAQKDVLVWADASANGAGTVFTIPLK